MKEIVKRMPIVKQVYYQWSKQKFANDCYGCF